MNPPPAGAAGCSLLEWDTAFFGFRIGRVQASTLDQAAAARVLEWGATQRIRCLYFSADGQSAETLACAAQAGFKFVDVRIDLLRPLAPTETFAPAGAVRPAQPGDSPALEAIARGSHHDTRFFKDGGFPADKAAELYAEWIRRDLRVHTVFTALSAAHEPAGYITCQVDAATREGRIGLIAVDAAHAGRGLGAALLRAALAWFAAQRCPAVLVATQASNVPAQRLYQAAGFRTIESSVWFHRWFPAS